MYYRFMQEFIRILVSDQIFVNIDIYLIQGVFTRIVTAGRVAVGFHSSFERNIIVVLFMIVLWMQSLLIVKLN